MGLASSTLYLLISQVRLKKGEEERKTSLISVIINPDKGKYT